MNETIPYRPDTHIDELSLSVRTYNALKNENLLTCGQIEKVPDAELMRIPNFGKVSLRELRALVPYVPDAPAYKPPIEIRMEALENALNGVRDYVGHTIRDALGRGHWDEVMDEFTHIKRRLAKIEGRLDDHLAPDPTDWPVLDQFNQMAMAVNRMVAIAGAIDTHKQELIDLTSNRINALNEQLSILRVRLRRLEAPEPATVAEDDRIQ